VNRKTFIAALGCALLATSLLGCGGSNKLQSITLSIGGQGGTFNLIGIGGILQLQATGNYSSTKTHDLTNVVTYTIVVDPVNNVDAFGNTLLPPPQTITLSPTGLLTAVDPATCTWVDVSADPTKPAWFISGDYMITATFQGVTSQPVFVAIASSAGNPDNPPLIGNNPTEQCGPTE
jgi:hypothetical protein